MYHTRIKGYHRQVAGARRCLSSAALAARASCAAILRCRSASCASSCAVNDDEANRSALVVPSEPSSSEACAAIQYTSVNAINLPRFLEAGRVPAEDYDTPQRGIKTKTIVSRTQAASRTNCSGCIPKASAAFCFSRPSSAQLRRWNGPASSPSSHSDAQEYVRMQRNSK